MICEFCKSEIADGALICPHCRQRTPAGALKARASFAVPAFWTVVALLVAVVISQAVSPTKPLRQRITAACAKQYPNDYAASDRCELALLVSSVDRDSQGRLERAARDAAIR